MSCLPNWIYAWGQTWQVARRKYMAKSWLEDGVRSTLFRRCLIVNGFVQCWYAENVFFFWITVKYVIKLNFLACMRFIVKLSSRNGLNNITNPVRIQAIFRLFWSSVIQKILEISRWWSLFCVGLLKMSRQTSPCWVAIVLFKTFVLLLQARLYAILLFYSRSRVVSWTSRFTICFLNFGNYNVVEIVRDKGKFLLRSRFL